MNIEMDGHVISTCRGENWLQGKGEYALLKLDVVRSGTFISLFVALLLDLNH